MVHIYWVRNPETLTKAMQKHQVPIFILSLFLAACATPLPPQSPDACPTCPACPPAVTTTTPSGPTSMPAAFSRSLQAAEWRDLPGWAGDDHAAAWPAFLQSCRGMNAKGGPWKRVCDLAANSDAKHARLFFETHLRPYAVLGTDNKAEGLMTGYYEALLRGSRNQSKQFPHPVRSVPDDLLTIDLSALYPELKDKRVRGRLEGNKILPYWSRAEIEKHGEHQHGRPLLYVDDALDLFLLQVQGSGRVKMPDGSMVRLNYADQNGHAYQSIGRILVERGELKLEEASIQGIRNWARTNPGKLNDLLNANPSYVFFREVADNGKGPIGALGVPLTAERSIAVDPRSVPLGTPVFMATTRPNSDQPMNRLVMAQDTGGAIKGAVRADFFWGFGQDAGEQAGKMRQSGRLWMLLPPEAAPK